MFWFPSVRNSLANLTNQIQFSVEYRKLFFWIVSRNFKCGKKGCCAHFRHKAKIEFNFDDYLRHIAIGVTAPVGCAIAQPLLNAVESIGAKAVRCIAPIKLLSQNLCCFKAKKRTVYAAMLCWQRGWTAGYCSMRVRSCFSSSTSRARSRPSRAGGELRMSMLSFLVHWR